MRNILFGFLVTLMGFVASAAAFALPILELDVDPLSGQLLGAKNVSVLGSTYDVAFLDGTCGELFRGCDEEADFAFSNQLGAIAASEALLATVFFDSAAGSFDSSPELTNGCSSASGCFIFTPFPIFPPSIGFQAIVGGNAADEVNDSPFISTISTADPTFSTAQNDSTTWAVWAPVAVPEPGSLALLALGLAGLGYTRGKRLKQG